MIGVEIHDQASRISDLKNPFMADKVIRFSTYCNAGWGGQWSYTGTIEFQNGNTKGEQKFKGDDFGSLLKKMEQFMADLGAET